jgi:hypothetical protein
LPFIFGCVAEPLWRRRIESAVRETARVRWHETFAAMRQTLDTETARVSIALVDLQDPRGASAEEFARSLRAAYPAIGIVAYHRRSDDNAKICLLGASGVHDLLVAGHTDEGFVARSILMDACRQGAANRVLTEMTRIVPSRLMPFVEAAIRNPGLCRITEVTDYLGVHRQTPNAWCRKERMVRGEELLVWCRLLLVAGLLEMTSRTIESIAIEFEYASATSLRNHLKTYTGMTATEIRARGSASIVELFEGRIAQARAGWIGQSGSDRPPDAGLRLLASS